jgi:hypothetical protein
MSGAFAQKIPTPPKGVTKTTYGDVTLEKFDSVKGNFKFTGLVVVGKDSLITVPYPRSNSTLKLHANSITTKKRGEDYFAETDMTGNVRVTITQRLKSGKERILQSTSQSGSFRRDAQKIELRGDVRATITDEENLAEPANLRAQVLTVDMRSIPYRYTLSGNEEENEIHFIALSKPTSEGKQTPPRTVHVKGYQTASFRSADEGIFEGKNTMFAFREADGSTQAQMRAPYIRAVFKGERGSVSYAEITGGANYTVVRSHPNTKAQERLKGTAEKVLFDPTKDTLTISGGIRATLDAPETLAVPAQLRVEKVTIRTTQLSRYDMEADPKTALFSLTPKQKDKAPTPKTGEANAENPQEPIVTFQVGTVRVTQFTKGSFEEDKEADFEGNRLLFESREERSNSVARFLTRNIHAEFSKNNLLKSATASGEVEYFFQQVPPPSKEDPKAEPLPQVLSGKALKVTATNGTSGQTLEIAGPFRTDIVLPDKLLEPGLITGEAGDRILLTWVEGGYDFDVTTPNQTAFIRLLPRELAEEQGKEKKPKTAEPKPNKGKPTL